MTLPGAGRGQPRDDDGAVGALASWSRARNPAPESVTGAPKGRAGRRDCAMTTRPLSSHDGQLRAVRLRRRAWTCDATPVPGSRSPRRTVRRPSGALRRTWSDDPRPAAAARRAVDPARLVGGLGTVGRQVDRVPETSPSPAHRGAAQALGLFAERRHTMSAAGAPRPRSPPATSSRLPVERVEDGAVAAQPSRQAARAGSPRGCACRDGGRSRAAKRPSAVGGDGRVERLAGRVVAGPRGRVHGPGLGERHGRGGRASRDAVERAPMEGMREHGSRAQRTARRRRRGCAIWRTRPRATRG